MNRLLGLVVTLVAGLAWGLPRAAADDPKPGKSDEVITLVEAVQTLAGQQLYQTYQTLDTIIEFRFFGVRDASELARMIASAVESATEAERQLGRVAGLKGLSKEDAVAIARLKKIAGLLREQGTSLQVFLDTGVAYHWKQSEAARKAAWKELEEALELNPKKGIAPPPREPKKP